MYYWQDASESAVVHGCTFSTGTSKTLFFIEEARLLAAQDAVAEPSTPRQYDYSVRQLLKGFLNNNSQN